MPQVSFRQPYQGSYWIDQVLVAPVVHHSGPQGLIDAIASIRSTFIEEIFVG